MIRRDQQDDMPRGEARARAYANRLRRETGAYYYVVSHLFDTPYFGAWTQWTVRRRTVWLFWRHVATYDEFNGALIR